MSQIFQMTVLSQNFHVNKNIDSSPPASDSANSSTHSDGQNPPAQLPSNPDHSVIDDESIFQADRILKSRRKKSKMEYLVQWHNFPRNQSTWEPEQNILHKRLIVNFIKSRK